MRTRIVAIASSLLASLALAATSSAAFAGPVGSASAAEAIIPHALLGKPALSGLDAFEPIKLMETVEHLASPELQGRLAGGPGFMQAAREMAQQFERIGLKPGGDDGFFQNLMTEYADIEVCRLALIRPDGSERALVLGRDFTCRGFTGSGDFTAPVVFVGYGLSVPEKGFDDYAGIDARGKIVLAFKETPPFQADPSGWGESGMPRPKGLVAAAHGARGLLLVSRPNQERPQKPIGSLLEGEGEQDLEFPRLQVSVEAGEEIVRSIGLGLAELEARIDSTKAPCSRELKLSARIGVQARYEAKRPSVNVVGIFEGSDPRVKGQCVVLGAHLDHVGTQGREILFPGANDNASGCAVVLAAARAFAESGARPRRSVIFGLWSSEESGLFGAKRFVERPPVPRDSLIAYLNFDCVGHGDSIAVGGGEGYPQLWRIARDLDRDDGRLMVEETWKGGGADADPFEEAQIPNLYFNSRFSYTNLHLTTDTPETLNPSLLAAMARLGFQTAWMVAQGEGGASEPGSRSTPSSTE